MSACENVRIVSTMEVAERLNDEFWSSNPFFPSYRDTSLWAACMRFVENPMYLAGIIFANDILGIPPAESSIELGKKENRDLFRVDLPDRDKQFIGAFWGFVFRKVLAYRDLNIVDVEQPPCSYATRHTDPERPILVRDLKGNLD